MFINTISESKSKIYSECHLKYKYRYINRYEEEAGNADALHFGSYIHRILELGVDASGVDQLRIIADQERNNYDFPDSMLGRVDRCLKNFFEFNKNLSETVATEMVYEVVYDEEKDIRLNGVIDRIVKGDDGSYLIIDYKTSKRELSDVDLFQDRQLQGYAYAIHKMMKVPIDKIVVAHFYPLTGKFVHVKFFPSQIKKYLSEKVKQVWEIRKKKKDEFRPIRNNFCKWCGYQSLCPEFNDQMVVNKRVQKLDEEKRKKSNKNKK
jgi:putative RecB family exonuclease